MALGDCDAGGGFVHPELGRAHRVRAGDIFLVNPAELHCTAEFGQGGEGRRMVAIFVKSDVVGAACTAGIVQGEHGLPGATGPKRRRKH